VQLIRQVTCMPVRRRPSQLTKTYYLVTKLVARLVALTSLGLVTHLVTWLVALQCTRTPNPTPFRATRRMLLRVAHVRAPPPPPLRSGVGGVAVTSD
jgi:hypothetical protein